MMGRALTFTADLCPGILAAIRRETNVSLSLKQAVNSRERIRKVKK